MENKITLPIGMSNFTEIRKNHYYYIDKTGLIENLLQNDLARHWQCACWQIFLIFVKIVGHFLMDYI